MASGKDIRSAAGGRSTTTTGTSTKRLQADLDATSKKLDNMKSAVKRAKENSGRAGKSLMHSAETVFTAGLSSAISGAAPKRFRKFVRGGRILAAVVTGGWGMVRTLNGQDGCHLTAIADGFAASELSETAFCMTNDFSAKRGWWGKSVGVDGAVIGGESHPRFIPEVAVTPPAGRLTDVGVEEVYPDNPELMAFRNKGFVRTRSLG